MISKFRSAFSAKLIAILVVGLGVGFLVATGAAHADNSGSGAPCVLDGVTFLDGNTGEIDGITYTCTNGTIVETAPLFPNGTPTPPHSLKKLPSMVEGHAHNSTPGGITAANGILR